MFRNTIELCLKYRDINDFLLFACVFHCIAVNDSTRKKHTTRANKNDKCKTQYKRRRSFCTRLMLLTFAECVCLQSMKINYVLDYFSIKILILCEKIKIVAIIPQIVLDLH